MSCTVNCKHFLGETVGSIRLKGPGNSISGYDAVILGAGTKIKEMEP